MGEETVRGAFARQAEWCERLGSPFTALLCDLIGARLDRSGAIGRRVLGWPGDPNARADALPLRLCGGLHFLVRSGDAPRLASLYPPGPLPAPDALWQEVEAALDQHSGALLPWLESAPQTNEVGRSAVLMAGLLAIAYRFPLPFELYELGASAGLNLVLDRYVHRLGEREAGDPGSPLRLEPEWKGPPPPQAEVRIAARAGVDLRPASPTADRDRLLAYIWPDQRRRLAQLETALDIASADPPRIDEGDAADWIEAQLARPPEVGVARVVTHSIAWQYFPEATRARIRNLLERLGSAADEGRPLAWLRFETEREERYGLRVRTWPGEERLLALAHPHGSSMRWL